MLKIIANKDEIYKLSKNKVFNKYFRLLSDNNNVWPSDIQYMFELLKVNNAEDLIGIKKTELFNFYKTEVFGEMNIGNFEQVFIMNGFEFGRISLRINGKPASSNNVLKFSNKEKQKLKQNEMKKYNIIYYDKNKNENITEKYASSKNSLLQYSLNNLIKY